MGSFNKQTLVPPLPESGVKNHCTQMEGITRQWSMRICGRVAGRCPFREANGKFN